MLKYKIPEGYLFYPAQFWPHKNHIGILYAVNLLREKYGIKIPAVFVGSDTGNLRHIQEKVVELKLTSQIYLLGFVSLDDMASLYRKAFALIYPTYFGPENLPPLEAFALGCPVIASDVPGAKEQLGNAALLVDPKNPEAIAFAVKLLYNDPALKQTIVKRGAKRASNWTGKDFVKSIYQIIDELEPIRRCWSNHGNY
jgi:glycosyltransferase involved in cell wall biosynthesis